MRELTLSEIQMVSGAGDECPAGSGNNIEGISNFQQIGDDLVALYEGVVQVTSHIIERVANAL
jgi:hypothetical protein